MQVKLHSVIGARRDASSQIVPNTKMAEGGNDEAPVLQEVRVKHSVGMKPVTGVIAI